MKTFEEVTKRVSGKIYGRQLDYHRSSALSYC